MDQPLTSQTQDYNIVIHATVELPVGLSKKQVADCLKDLNKHIKWRRIVVPDQKKEE